MLIFRFYRRNWPLKMVNGRIPTVCSKTYVTPRRPYEKARLEQELVNIGVFGLRNKREVWRVKYTLAKIRKAARELLTLEEKDPKRLFEGAFFCVFSWFLHPSATLPRTLFGSEECQTYFVWGILHSPARKQTNVLPWFCLCRKLRRQFFFNINAFFLWS